MLEEITVWSLKFQIIQTWSLKTLYYYTLSPKLNLTHLAQKPNNRIQSTTLIK